MYSTCLTLLQNGSQHRLSFSLFVQEHKSRLSKSVTLKSHETRVVAGRQFGRDKSRAGKSLELTKGDRLPDIITEVMVEYLTDFNNLDEATTVTNHLPPESNAKPVLDTYLLNKEDFSP